MANLYNETLETLDDVTKLIRYLQVLDDFVIVDSMDGCYNHMGATLTDAILQAGINYETVVRPRVNHVKSTYPEAVSTRGFKEVLEKSGAENVLNFTGYKIERLLSLVDFLIEENVQTEADFAVWLANPLHILKLKQVKGIGDKTADYLKILVGLETNAVDRHLINFLELAGIRFVNYQKTSTIINTAADVLHVRRALFDHSIWRYMSDSDRIKNG